MPQPEAGDFAKLGELIRDIGIALLTTVDEESSTPAPYKRSNSKQTKCFGSSRTEAARKPTSCGAMSA